MQRAAVVLFSVMGLVGVVFGILPIQGWVETHLSSDRSLVPQNIYFLGQLLIPSLGFGFASLAAAAGMLWCTRCDCLPVFDKISAGTRLLLVSVWALYLEVFLIKYFGQQILVFGYFKNMILISAFLGLGLGMMLPARFPNTTPLHAPLIGALFFLAYSPFGKLLGSIKVPSGEEMVMWSFNAGQTLIQHLSFYGVMLMVFTAVVGAFVPLGQWIGRDMGRLPRLKGYLLNLGGSLAGVLVITMLSFMSVPPWWQFLIGIPMVLLLPGLPRKVILIWLLLHGYGMWMHDKVSVWGPYNPLRASPVMVKTADGIDPIFVYAWDKKEPEGPVFGYALALNQAVAMRALNLSPKFLDAHPQLRRTRRYRLELVADLPFEATRPRSALVLGSGIGADVSAGLRQGARHIDAVEIDPGIMELGKKLNPEGALTDSRVRTFVDDARSFLRKTDRTYDLIAYSLLDSRIVVSGMSSNRVDSFMYTLESFQDAAAILSKRGVITVRFSYIRPWIWERIERLARDALPGHPVWTNGRGFLAAGPGVNAETIRVLQESAFAPFHKLTKSLDHVRQLRDNRPYLYLREWKIPHAYIIMMVLLGLVGAVVIRFVRGGSSLAPSQHLHFAALGAGFLLMETKIITEVAVLFGSTWTVNSVAFAIVLAQVLAATLLRYRYPKLGKPAVLYGVLAVALVAQYFVPLSIFLDLPAPARFLAGFVYYGIPFCCSSWIFANSLSKFASQRTALGSNLVGSVVGGFLEYTSLMFGMKALCLVALGLYLLSWVTAPFRKR